MPMRMLIFVGVFLLAGITFFTGIDWGLPSRQGDAYLFGNRTPWTGREIMKLAGDWDNSGARGADIAMHPVDLHGAMGRGVPIELNDTDAKRAEIVRRYRLYSSQPDEMITFRSLSRMKPGRGDLDPRMYQYGGLWIYPVGILLKVGAWAGFVTLRTDLAYYLDYPAAFGRFYLVARFYSAMWGMIGVGVVFLLAKEWSGEFLAGAAAAGIYASMPVVINLAHEAKPHLPGMVLVMMCVWAGLRYARSGLVRWWVLAGVFAGAAMGMILTGYVAFAVLPMMVLFRPMGWGGRIGVMSFATLIGVLVFIITNPYLPFNLLAHRAVLDSNVGNYGTFYQPRLSISGVIAAGKYLVMGISPGPAVMGVLAFIAIARFRLKKGLLLAAPAIVVLIQFVALADDKTAEYARFGLLPEIFAGVISAVLIARLRFKGNEKALLAGCLVAGTLYFGIRYDINYVADGWSDSTRQYGAKVLQAMKRKSGVLAMHAEPAPYCLPPVDLFSWRILLFPRHGIVAANMVEVKPVDAVVPLAVADVPIGAGPEPIRVNSPISWGNKPFEILIGDRNAR